MSQTSATSRQPLANSQKPKANSSSPTLYCAGCGLMRMKNERGPCVRCNGTKHTQNKPEAAGTIRAVGITRFTSFTIGNERI